MNHAPYEQGPVTRYMNTEACVEKLQARLDQITEILDQHEANHLGLDGTLLEIRDIVTPRVAPIPVEI